MKNNKNAVNSAPSADAFDGFPQDAEDMVNKYGTYNIQPTAESENKYPAVAQGMPKNGKLKSAERTALNVIEKEVKPPQK